MDLFWWIFSFILIGIGFAGTIVPFIPGAVLILAGAIVHRLALGAEESASWWTIGGLVLLAALSYALEFLSGSIGAKIFGATRWGIIGGLAGGIIGLFFGLIGLLIGPILGVLLGELLGGQRFGAATKSTWGTVLGSTAGIVAKLVIALIMIAWFTLALLA